MNYDDRPFILQVRKHYEVNTDPQRRCYNGCHFSSEIQVGPWTDLDRLETEQEADRKKRFWEDLNAYAVSARGPSAKMEYRIISKEVPDADQRKEP